MQVSLRTATGALHTEDGVSMDQHPLTAIRRLTADSATVVSSVRAEICSQSRGDGPTESVLGSIHAKIK